MDWQASPLQVPCSFSSQPHIVLTDKNLYVGKVVPTRMSVVGDVCKNNPPKIMILNHSTEVLLGEIIYNFNTGEVWNLKRLCVV